MNVSIETYGCATNQADSEYIVGLLLEHGFSVGEEGDVIIVNTCTVKSPTDAKIKKRLRELSSGGKRVVVAGCMPAADHIVLAEFPDYSFIGTNVSDIVAAVEAAASGGRYVNICSSGDKMCIPKVRANPVVEIIPILEGCLGSCSYCIVRKARGALKSYPASDIVDRVKEAVSDGVREVWLTSQDNGAYGKDADSSLPELLQAVSEVEGEFRVRVGMANPNHVAGFLDELVDAFADERIYRFLHVPVQSGSDRVLKDMGRTYSIDDFKGIVDAFRGRYDATISTDVIAGYPTETDEDFQETVTLIKEVKPDVLNVSRFWARPGTDAARLKQLPGRETKKRSRVINQVFKKVGLEGSKRWVGWMGECLASQKNTDGTYTVRNSHYKPIVVKTGEDILGKTVNVTISKATYFDLRGKILKT